MIGAQAARLLLTAVLAVAMASSAAAQSSDTVDLRDVAALTFRRGKMTTSRRVSAVPQVHRVQDESVVAATAADESWVGVHMDEHTNDSCNRVYLRACLLCACLFVRARLHLVFGWFCVRR